MTEKLKVHLLVLPRWFGLPTALCAVALGGLLVGAGGVSLALVLVSGALVMAQAHSFNTLLDYSWTGFDKGGPGERSRPKAYTTGQSVIASGLVSPREVLANALAWWVLSAVPLIFLNSPWIWLPWALACLCTFGYSWGKLHWLCEFFLGFGFATCAVWLGMAAAGQPDWGKGLLASVPFFILWGYLAESVDQALDWEPNWPRGLRNIGALAGHEGIPFSALFHWFLPLVYLSQVFLIGLGVLSSWTWLTLLAAVPMTFCALIIDKDTRKGVLWGLGGISLYQIALVVGQWLGG